MRNTNTRRHLHTFFPFVQNIEEFYDIPEPRCFSQVASVPRLLIGGRIFGVSFFPAKRNRVYEINENNHHRWNNKTSY